MKQDRQLYKSEQDKVSLIESNLCLQFKEVLRLIDDWKGSIALTPAAIKDLHRLAIKDIYSCAGQFRSWPVRIRGSQHKPPDSENVGGLVNQMCDDANGNPEWKPVKTAAFLLWKLTWIHPFGGGNGRTARAVAYLALCVRLGFLLPGKSTINEYLDTNRGRYIEALTDADAAWKNGVVDLSRMESLLSDMLMLQIAPLPPVAVVRQSPRRPRPGRSTMTKMPPGDPDEK